jgi:hypothetical protein
MEVVSHGVRGRDPQVVGEHCVERAAQRVGVPSFADAHSNCLSARMHPCIGPTGAERGSRLRAQAAQRVFQNPLHGPPVRLPLPPAEASAVVVQHELQHASRHRVKSY